MRANIFRHMWMGTIAAGLLILTVGASTNAPIVHGKSDQIGCYLTGTIKNLHQENDGIHFDVLGHLRLSQYNGEGLTNHAVIEINCEKGLTATLREPAFFFAMTTDWSGGSLRDKKGALRQILTTAVEQRSQLKFELVDPQLSFGKYKLTNLVSSIVRITDANLH